MNIAPNERRRSAVGAILSYGLTQEKEKDKKGRTERRKGERRSEGMVEV